MGRLIIFAVSFMTAFPMTSLQAVGDFKRMPDIRGQSFGLENFLLEPFNLPASASPQIHNQKHGDHAHSESYSVEFQVKNDDFDMSKLVPTLPGASMVLNQASRQKFKPVHEDVLDSEPPQQFRKTFIEKQTERPFQRKKPNIAEEVQSIVPRRRLPPPETRRPLEKPSEFMVSITEHVEPFPALLAEPTPHRKRVMKRRRKKPSTPQPEIVNDDKPTKEDEAIKDIVDNLFSNVPTSYQQTMKDVTGSESIMNEQGAPRMKPAGYKRRQQAAAQAIFAEGSLEAKMGGEGLSRYEDKLLSEATQTVPQKQIIESSSEGKADVLTPTTDNPGESTQRLKTLLKQQNGQLSLSELLQTQNLSLADFLKGNPGALSALGGTRINVDKTTETPFATETESPKPVFPPHVPKISSKSRPFSKPLNASKIVRIRSTTTSTTTSTTEKTTVEDLPKKLQIVEVTSEKPSYNGFTPKRPRVRLPLKNAHKYNYSREKMEAENSSSTERVSAEVEDGQKEKNSEEMKIEEEDFSHSRVTSTTSPASTTEKTVPKRFGEYRPKLKFDRRKPLVESTTEGFTATEKQEETTMVVTEEAKTVGKDWRNRVRIPFMSVNNPEISLILPSKKASTTTEKPRPSPVVKDRINVFKRLNSEEKVTNENTLESRETGATDGISTANPLTTTTMTAASKSTTTEQEMMGNETSDEILELLKTGNNAVRLNRILAARNMTVNELVEKRANSSRQPNVTHLFDRKLDPELIIGKHTVHEQSDNDYPSTERTRAPHTTKRILPVFDIPSPNYKIENGEKIRVRTDFVKLPESNGFDELFVDESVVRPIRLSVDSDEIREGKAYETLSRHPTGKPNRLFAHGMVGKAEHPKPLWNMNEKSLYTSNPSYPTYDLNDNLASRRTTTEMVKTTEDEMLVVETIQNHDAHSRLKSSISDILKEQVEVKEVKEDLSIIPPAVKSAIIASGVVMGIALVVFVAIFAACGWKQRQFRIRARSSILNDSIDGSTKKAIRCTGTLSPVSFKRSALYKKSIDFDTESSASSSSNTSSYLWNTLKHTFQSRNSTLKNRQDKEEKLQEKEIRSRRNTLCRDEERPRKSTLTRDEPRRESVIAHDVDFPMPRRDTLTREDLRRKSVLSRDHMQMEDSLSRDLIRTESRRNSCYRDERRINHNLARENARSSFRTIDPDQQIIQTSVNFKRGGYNSSSRRFDSCDHFN